MELPKITNEVMPTRAHSWPPKVSERVVDLRPENMLAHGEVVELHTTYPSLVYVVWDRWKRVNPKKPYREMINTYWLARECAYWLARECDGSQGRLLTVNEE
jgi:hypothetical protein